MTDKNDRATPAPPTPPAPPGKKGDFKKERLDALHEGDAAIGAIYERNQGGLPAKSIRPHRSESSSIVTRHNVKDEAWAQGVLDCLKNNLWSAQQAGAHGHLDEGRVNAILSKLRDELWSPVLDPKEREAWANHIIDKLRDELWTLVGSGPKRQPSPDEENRVDAILARLKNELWSH